MILFENHGDYFALEQVMSQARDHVDMRILAYCIMPTHWHMVLWPRNDGDLSEFMGWLGTTHTRRWHAFRKSTGTGHLYQGRFKSFPVQTDTHFFTVCRYVERNPLRASLITRAENWRWGSLWRRTHGDAQATALLDEWPMPLPANWVELVNTPLTQAELDDVRNCSARGMPFGDTAWTKETAARLGPQFTLKPPRGPKKD